MLKGKAMSADAPITSREGLRLWAARALQCAPEQIDEKESLIALGMNSLAMMRLPAQLKKAGVHVRFADLFQNPTLANWASLIDAGRSKGQEQVETPAAARQPFALTDMQRAYWLGREPLFPLGGIAAHGYLEIALPEAGFDLLKLEDALNQTIAAHPMLRMRLTPDGRQEVLEEVPRYVITCHRGPEETSRQRAKMQSEILSAETWPIFRICVTEGDNSQRRFLHISFDILLFDITSLGLWLRQWHELYSGARTGIATPYRHFSQYIAEAETRKKSPQAQADKTWWMERAVTLPRAPRLPLARQPKELTPPTIHREQAQIEPKVWHALKRNAAKAGVTPSAMFTAMFAEALSRYSSSPDMTLNLTLFDRSGERAAYEDVLGDFTSMLPVAVTTGRGQSFAALSQAVQAEIGQGLSRAAISGAEVSAEIARAQGFSNENPLPVVLTCAAGSGTGSYLDEASRFGKLVFARNQAPQTWIDAQIADYHDGLSLVWDYVCDLFPDGMLAGMFNLFVRLVHELRQVEAWRRSAESLLVEQKNPKPFTHLPGADQTLFMPFLGHAARAPQAPALFAAEKTVTYGELERKSRLLAENLIASGLVCKGDLVGIALARGWRQVAAVLAVLRAGAAYLPVNVNDPGARLATVFTEGGVSTVLTDQATADLIPDAFKTVIVDDQILSTPAGIDLSEHAAQPEDTAYVIFTSGSTGKPKGVVVSHQAALNTIFDVNFRNNITSSDVLFAVSQLNFDLSVYDIFGALAAGAALSIPPASVQPEPAEWVRHIRSSGATVWNSVPALAQLLIDAARNTGESLISLRVFLLSGDWLGAKLARQILALPQHPRLVSMGGATEAAIWSVEKVVRSVAPRQQMIPYGKPLSGQMLHVLDASMRSCPTWVPGEIYIAGVGLAKGYFRQPELTEKAFILHPLTGERIYRTGDWGRWLPDGDIEFLGREDAQVKINGMRIELGEIEAVMTACPGVSQAVAVVAEACDSKRIAAFVVAAAASHALTEATIRKTLSEKLPSSWLPAEIYMRSALPLTINGKIDRRALADMAQKSLQSIPSRGAAVVTTRAQEQIATAWRAVLHGRRPGVDVSFFEAGGTSLLAMQLASRLTADLGRPIPVVSVFQYTTIASQAKHFIESADARPRDAERGRNRAQQLSALAAKVRHKG